MRSAVLAALMGGFLFLGCASVRTLSHADAIEPTEQQPVLACAWMCKDGGPMLSPLQHICGRGSNRQLRRVELIGVVLDHWIACSEWDTSVRPLRCTAAREYPKADVELRSCDSVKASAIAARDASERGIHPGEDAGGNPLPPKDR